jgi:signal transduction histidine kinase
VRVDRIKLSRVVGNLVGNAIKFTSQGEVRIEAGAERDGSLGMTPFISVRDTGIGIEPEYQQNIFDEFVQLHNRERDRNKGTGLGLTICKRLVDAMGGILELESIPGKGSAFTVKLPPATVVP